MNFSLYQAEDFASDESFIAYYLRTDESAIHFWEDWISRNPEKLDEVLNAERLIDALTLRLPTDEFNIEKNRFEDFLSDSAATIEETKISPQKFNGKRFALILSIFFIISIGSIFIYKQSKNPSTVQSYVTRYNGHQKISIIWLSDGSKITLNANSTLTYPKKFSAQKRDVKLSGEAFFEVAKDKSRPFTVQANGTKTRVLGTKFNVSAYQDMDKIKVALLEGNVEFSASNQNQKMLLKPNEMAVFSSKSKRIEKTRFDKNDILEWKNAVIAFHNASFKDIQSTFLNVYGITLLNKTDDTLWNYTGRFEKTDYLTVIKSICFSKNLTFNQLDQTITLISKK